MLTTKFILLHSKCLRILAMVQRVDLRIEASKAQLYIYDYSKNPFDIIKLVNTREGLVAVMEYERYLKERLLNYYATTTVNLIGDVLIKMSNAA